MDGLLSNDNIATRKGSKAVEVSLRFDLPTVNVCSSDFLGDLADVIVSSVGRTDKRLLRLYCTSPIVNVQILNTYVPVKTLLPSGDVALELQRQLSFPESPFLSNTTGVDPSFRPRPLQVMNCSDNSPIFEPSCSVVRSAPNKQAWLGLEAYSAPTIVIFAATAVLLCALAVICGLCVRRLWQDKKKVGHKAKWIVAVQQEQATELAAKHALQPQPSKECPATPSPPQLPLLLPSSPLTPPPLPLTAPPVQSPNTFFHAEYEDDNDLIDMDTPPSGDNYEGNIFALDEVVCEQHTPRGEEGEEEECLNLPPATVTNYLA